MTLQAAIEDIRQEKNEDNECDYLYFGPVSYTHLDRHYEHKQYAFDSYCKKILKCEACNGYRQISRRQKRFASLEELSEAEMAQLAVYDRYSWEYTTFPVGGAVILIEDDRLAEALLGLSHDICECIKVQ